MTIGEAMKNARQRAGLTQNKLAKISGIPVSCINGYEGDRFIPTVLKVEILADALGISIDEYIGHKVKEGSEK